jgi:hypothetical protein
MRLVKDFVDNKLIPDLLAIAPYYLYLKDYGAGHKNYISVGVLDAKSQDPYDRFFPRGAILGGELKLHNVDIVNDIKEYRRA